MVSSLEPGLLSTEFPSREEFKLEAGSVYLFAESVERRSHLPTEWSILQDGNFVEVVEGDYGEFSFTALGKRFQLRSGQQLDKFLDEIFDAEGPVYLDITGLSHHVWAPLASRLFGRVLRGKAPWPVSIVYVEPRHYKKSSVPRTGDIFALSERSHGISPIPGMATLRRSPVGVPLLVGLLGFEGWRFEAILSAFEPDAGSVVPVIGVPGFRAEYPFYTVEGNHRPLDKDDNWIRRKFATANDPFEVFDLLSRLSTSGVQLRIAMVGTKPHSLGAVLFVSAYPERGELVYDNPIRAEGRTDQGRRVQVYDLSAFGEALEMIGWIP